MVELLTPLAAAGHAVDVCVTAVLSPYTGDLPIDVRRIRALDSSARYDVIVYNSGLPTDALETIKRMPGRKLMCQHSYQTQDPGLRFAEKVWFPSYAAMRAHTLALPRKLLFSSPPPINPDRYRTTPGAKIGLSLSSPWKGGLLVASMARAMTNHRFLVVKDGRGSGVSAFRGINNVELVDFMDPRDFYSRTRVQVFPSKSETYGRVGVEGAISGIPLVASPDPGIREAMDGHGIYLDRNDLRAWVKTVGRLMTDEDAWHVASSDVAQRGNAIRYRDDQAAFVTQVESLAARG
jgi:glycosyltransferase involved in cell wall biosynthesis